MLTSYTHQNKNVTHPRLELRTFDLEGQRAIQLRQWAISELTLTLLPFAPQLNLKNCTQIYIPLATPTHPHYLYKVFLYIF